MEIEYFEKMQKLEEKCPFSDELVIYNLSDIVSLREVFMETIIRHTSFAEDKRGAYYYTFDEIEKIVESSNPVDEFIVLLNKKEGARYPCQNPYIYVKPKNMFNVEEIAKECAYRRQLARINNEYGYIDGYYWLKNDDIKEYDKPSLTEKLRYFWDDGAKEPLVYASCIIFAVCTIIGLIIFEFFELSLGCNLMIISAILFISTFILAIAIDNDFI